MPIHQFAALLPPTHVWVDVAATDVAQAFDEAGRMFEKHTGLSQTGIIESLHLREQLGSTGLGCEVAIPHGRIKKLKQPLAAIMRLQQGVAMAAPDDMPVKLLIFLLVPEAATQKHLELLSEIAEMLSNDDLRDTLLQAPDALSLHARVMMWQSQRDPL